MATPNARDNPLEVNSQSVDFSAQVHIESTPPSMGSSQPGAITTNWLNFGFLSIGAVAAVGLLLVLFSAYALKPANVNIIIVGSIILLISVVAWIVAALIMVSYLFRQLMVSRRGKRLRARPTQRQR